MKYEGVNCNLEMKAGASTEAALLNSGYNN